MDVTPCFAVSIIKCIHATTFNGFSRSRTDEPIPLHKEEKAKRSEEDIQRINILQLSYANRRE